MPKKLFALAFLVLSASLFAKGKPIDFSADRMSGTAGKKTSVTVLEGNAVVKVGSLQITGDRIELSGEDFRYVTATGNITGKDDEKGYSFTSGQLSYDREREVAAFTGDAKLIDTKHEVEASASMISYNQKTETAFLQVDVKLKRKKINCTSNFAVYRRTISMLDLAGSPYVVRDNDEFRADRISVNLDTEYITLDGSVSGTIKQSDAQKGDAPADGKTDAANGNPAAASGSATSPDASGKSAPSVNDTPASAAPAESNSSSGSSGKGE